jgi:hypothetical protein
MKSKRRDRPRREYLLCREHKNCCVYRFRLKRQHEVHAKTLAESKESWITTGRGWDKWTRHWF